MKNPLPQMACMQLAKAYFVYVRSARSAAWPCEWQPRARPLNMASEGSTNRKGDARLGLNTAGSACRCVNRHAITKYQVHQACMCALKLLSSLLQVGVCVVSQLHISGDPSMHTPSGPLLSRFRALCQSCLASSHTLEESSEPSMRMRPRTAPKHAHAPKNST